MIFENLNILTFIIVFIGIVLFGYIFYINYLNYKNNKKKYSRLFTLNFNRYIFLFISVVLLLIGIFHIKGGEKKQNIKSKGVDIEFVLDVSKSMNTVDIKYGNNITTRLDFIKKAISDYVSKNPNNRYGLTIFSKTPIGILPLTSDTNIFLTMLDGVDYRNLTKQGSDFSSAIKFGIDRFTDKKRAKVLVFVSDGGDNGDYKGLNFNVPDNIKFVVLGVGTKSGGKIYLGLDDFGDVKYQIYNGQYVITKLNEQNLKNIVKDLKADYLHIENISDIYKLNNYLKNIQKKAIDGNIITTRNDLTRYIIILSFIMFLIYFVLEIGDYK